MELSSETGPEPGILPHRVNRIFGIESAGTIVVVRVRAVSLRSCLSQTFALTEVFSVTLAATHSTTSKASFCYGRRFFLANRQTQQVLSSREPAGIVDLTLSTENCTESTRAVEPAEASFLLRFGVACRHGHSQIASSHSQIISGLTTRVHASMRELSSFADFTFSALMARKRTLRFPL